MMPFSFADAALMALSKASGPSMMASVICPLSAILQSAAASIVAIIFGLTVSTAASTPTFGRLSNPNTTRHRSTAFWTISALSARSGTILTAASVMMNGFG